MARFSRTRAVPVLLAACREGDQLVVTRLDRLARSPPDARDIVDELTVRQVKLNLGGSVHDPNDPVGRLHSSVLAMVAEFESDLIAPAPEKDSRSPAPPVASADAHPSSSPSQEHHLVELHHDGDRSVAELAELFDVGRSTVDRAIHRAEGGAATHAASTGIR